MSISLGGITAALDTSATDKSNAVSDKLKTNLNNVSNESSEDELKAVIKDFESYFVEEMLKKMKDTFTQGSEGADKTASQYTDFFMDYAIEEMADKLIDEVGSGITQDLYEQMKRNIDM